MKNKILCFTLSLMLCCTFTNVTAQTVKNQNSNENIMYEIKTNEYSQLKRQISIYKTKLKERKNVQKSDIDEYNALIKALEEYPKYIKQMQTYSVKELKSLNYTSDQIEAIQKYDGTEDMTERASASVTGTYRVGSYRYDSKQKKTFATMYTTTIWSGRPFFIGTDQLALTMSASKGNFIHISSSCTATYKLSNGSVFDYIPSKEIPLNGAVKFKLPMQRYSNTLGAAGVLWKTSATYQAAVSGYCNLISFRPCYAHEVLEINNSVGISFSGSSSGAGGGISISVGKGFEKSWFPNAKTASL